MSPSELWIWLEALPIASHIGGSWWFPLLESIHVLSATFVLGSILMLDLRLLGLAALGHTVSRITAEVVPLTYRACAVSVVTGFGLFMSRASHYADNRAFEIKMTLLVLAGINVAVFHLITMRGVAAWDTGGATTASARFAGGCSLLLWAGIMLAGRWTGHLL